MFTNDTGKSKKNWKSLPQAISNAGLLFSQPVVVRYTHIIYRLVKKWQDGNADDQLKSTEIWLKYMYSLYTCMPGQKNQWMEERRVEWKEG